MRAFLSSTCHDLIDVRAEIAALLTSLGVIPVLSDDKLSGFELRPDTNSIETCLVNLANSDVVVVILNERYGPRLGDYGFENVSATHLEYRHAKELGKPIYFYVRDRLEADFNAWRKNQEKSGSLRLAWVRSEADHGLFELISEHRQLKNADENNWYSTFTSTIDLKASVRRQLNETVKPKLVLDAISRNQFPLFEAVLEPNVISRPGGPPMELKVRVALSNVGGAPAFNIRSRWEGEERHDVWNNIVAPNRSIPITLLAPISGGEVSVRTKLHFEFDAALGVHVSETYSVFQRVQNARFEHRTFYGGITLDSRKFQSAPHPVVDFDNQLTDESKSEQ